MGCKTYIKIFIFLKLLIRWVDCSSCGDDNPSGVDLVPKVEFNGMLNKEEKTELAKMLNQGMDERVEFLGQLFLISNF